MKYRPKILSSNVNISPTSPWKEFLLLAGGLLGIAVVLYLVLGFAVELLVPRLSPKIEQALANNLLRKLHISENDAPEKNKALQELLDRLQQHCPGLPYHCTIRLASTQKVNAIALPGGTIVIFAGLLDTVTSENELAFVLAHELGHFSHRDHLRGMGRGLVVMTLGTLLLGTDSQINQLLASALNLTEMRFSRRQESSADLFALEVVQSTYGHTGGALAFFEKLALGDRTRYTGHYFSTHPQHSQRINDLQDYCFQQGFQQGPLTPLPGTLSRP
ncbi:MAG: M48 family metallopeptidase [Deltaproteobacteria bacterium]|nr:M48 family metallopeptidase [Candidatus Anaeroferrophillus wilburensis]MBN2887959.1 M48 family metallopeptidase [Deltaproteobacteria bacterium]